MAEGYCVHRDCNLLVTRTIPTQRRMRLAQCYLVVMLLSASVVARLNHRAAHPHRIRQELTTLSRHFLVHGGHKDDSDKLQTMQRYSSSIVSIN